MVTLAVYWPMLLMVSLLVAATSCGPIWVRKVYRRRSGEQVTLYEFRTECWRTWQETPTGAFLRGLGLHGLPRMVNVLRGDVLAGERLELLKA